MVNASNTGQNLLPEFQKFLCDRKLVAENKTSYFAYWVSRYLSYAGKQKVSADEYRESVVSAFIDELRADARLQEWQPRQADDALKLYYFHYLGQSKSQSDTLLLKDAAAALVEMSRLIRVKHYSYNTERTYLQWAERFLAYAAKTGQKQISDLTTEDVRNYLTHLALDRRVSSSTQNQAFNALLFLFRQILHKIWAVSIPRYGRSGDRNCRLSSPSTKSNAFLNI